MSSDFKGRWRRLAAAFAALAVGAATAIAFAPAATAADPDRTTSVSVKSASTDGLTLTVSGTGYTDLPSPVGGMPGPAAGAYLGVYSDANIDTPSTSNAAVAVYLAYSPSKPENPKIVDGEFTQDVFVPANKLDKNSGYTLLVWSAHGNPAPASTIFQQKLTITADDWADIFPSTGDGDTSSSTTAPTTPVQRSTSASVISATSSGASVRVSGAGYSATDLPNGVYAALYDASKGGPEQMNGSQSGIAMDWITGFSADGSWSTTLSASAAALSAGGNYHVAVWPGHTDVSSSNILADIAVDLSGAAGGDAQGGTGTASAAVAEVDLAKDRAQTVTASGFTAGETVTGTLHSDPVDLGTQIADKDGKVTFAFQIPVGFEVGKHTVVLKGATSGHSVTVAFTVTDSAKAPATTATAGSKPAAGAGVTESASVLAESEICTEETVPGTAATPRLNWGVKSSFVAYLNTATAGGTITTAGGAAKAGDSFTWGTGSGSLGASGNGTVSFPGSIHITAHGGVLDLTISALKVTASGKTGTLTATIKSQDMQGNPVPVGSVVLADLSFSSLSATGGEATATLTAAGAKAFAGFYQAGEQLDPITVSFAGGSSATTKTVCRDADGNIISGGDAGLASTGVPVGQQLGVAVLLLLAGAGAVVLARRRREVQEGGHL